MHVHQTILTLRAHNKIINYNYTIHKNRQFARLVDNYNNAIPKAVTYHCQLMWDLHEIRRINTKKPFKPGIKLPTSVNAWTPHDHPKVKSSGINIKPFVNTQDQVLCFHIIPNMTIPVTKKDELLQHIAISACTISHSTQDTHTHRHNFDSKILRRISPKE